MPLFPLFVDLKGKKCVVIGGGKVSTRKLETLLEFGARIVVVSPEISDRIQELKWDGKVIVIKKKYSKEDLEGAYLVVAATSDRFTNDRVYTDAVKCGIWVNVADCPEKCTFVFPSVVKRQDIVVGISTSGTYPALSRAIRKKIADVLPEAYGSLLEILREYRKRVEVEIGDSNKRQEVLNKILDEVLFFEDSVSQERLKLRIEEIYREYKDEKDC